jgi:hypothetical protein
MSEQNSIGSPRRIVLDDHARRSVLVHHLIAVAFRHLERGEHGSMDRIQENFQFGIGAAFVEIDSEKRHAGFLVKLGTKGAC